MTAPLEGAAARPRRASITKVVLALSLTLNLFFVGGLVYTKIVSERWLTPQQRVRALARELTLAPDQREAFRSMIQVLRLKGQSMRAANQELVAQVWNEFRKAQPDQDNLARLFGQMADNRRQFQTEAGDALRALFAKLTPEQRVHFIDLARHQRNMIATRIWRLLAP